MIEIGKAHLLEFTFHAFRYSLRSDRRSVRAFFVMNIKEGDRF